MAAARRDPCPRFTPTRVGTMPRGTAVSFAPAVHPHARGDNPCALDALRAVLGSPPRAWGQLAFRAGVAASLRFTPTRVGTIRAVAEPLLHHLVHPHARGDNDVNAFARARPPGSPPRAWGQCLAAPVRALGGGSPPRAWGQ